VDDWGWANFGPHRVNNTSGNDEFETPNLAALAQEGIMLNRM
jgi:arylsulfatase A-like enzyme